jgi:hypothetical protein
MNREPPQPQPEDSGESYQAEHVLSVPGAAHDPTVPSSGLWPEPIDWWLSPAEVVL